MTEKKINVVFMIAELNVGGAEKMLYDLVTRLNKEVYSIRVVSFQDEGYFGPLLEKQGIEVIALNMKSKWHIFKLKKLWALLKKTPVDIIHSFMFHANVLGRILARIHKIPVNLSAVHTIERGARWHLCIDRLTRWMVTHETVVCKTAKEYMMKHTHIAPQSISVIQNGIVFDNFMHSYDVDVIKQKYGLPKNKFIIGTIGSLTKPKGHIHLLRAVRSVIEKEPSAHFVIVGKGPQKNLLAREIERLNIKMHINFIDYVSPVSEILSVFDCFVLTSLWEGVPIALLEAMAAECPIVVTDAGGMPDVIVDNDTGLIVPIGDHEAIAHAIVSLLRNKERACIMGRKARERVAQSYTVELMVKDTEDLYTRLV